MLHVVGRFPPDRRGQGDFVPAYMARDMERGLAIGCVVRDAHSQGEDFRLLAHTAITPHAWRSIDQPMVLTKTLGSTNTIGWWCRERRCGLMEIRSKGAEP